MPAESTLRYTCSVDHINQVDEFLHQCTELEDSVEELSKVVQAHKEARRERKLVVKKD